jgi:ABC-2 type transport system permease protein
MGALIVTNLKAAVAQRGKFWLQVSFMIVNNFAFLIFWWALFKRVGSLRGWVANDVWLLYGECALAFGLLQTFAGGVRHISRWVDQGELDPLLVQPKATWLYAIGSRAQPSGIGDFISGAALVGASGYVRWHNLPLLIVCVLCSACVFLGAALAFYSISFWWRRTEALSRQATEFLLLFSMYPESLFSGLLRVLLFSLLPAGFVSYVPVHILRDGRLREVPLLLAAAAGFLSLGVWVFGRGLRRYASGSRFGIWG